MKRFLNNRLSRLNLLVVISLYLASCTKSNDFLKYLEGGEITYTGKIDSVVVFSGKERVYVRGLFLADPKVVKLKVYWDNRGDSIEIPVVRTANIDTLKLPIPIKEGVHNFEFITFDAAGNPSLPVFKTGTSYGSRYISGLINRPIANSYISETDEGWIDWGGMDLTSGVFATQVFYQNTGGQEKAVIVPIDTTSSMLPEDYQIGSAVRYRTLFLPDTLSIDTFYTNFATTQFTRYVTSLYLKNTSAPFATSSFSGRWGIPADWITNTAVKNFLSNGVYYGGVDLNQNRRMTMEAGWTTGNLTSFTNGKIYQSATLPAGSYEYEVDIQDAGGGSFYIVVAGGEELPNIEQLAQDAIGYVNFGGKKGVLTIPFTLASETRLSFGFLGTLIGSSSTGQFWKANSVKLKFLAR
ncbi:DUF4998 domain-containing protein [Sphingobacterium pedocola]|uniref:DUF5013 domain-containing protein n=1 Tax=Sphingobacterium pedocola TaxID=2082722 RepID=A0ABR9TAA2_9SPHI|nr:DUF4998 domain-containing protein [Sphingobacterium pedocola]MBE8722215.1 hypothetical protein [Sphingobacterium pedocola]